MNAPGRAMQRIGLFIIGVAVLVALIPAVILLAQDPSLMLIPGLFGYFDLLLVCGAVATVGVFVRLEGSRQHREAVARASMRVVLAKRSTQAQGMHKPVRSASHA